MRRILTILIIILALIHNQASPKHVDTPRVLRAVVQEVNSILPAPGSGWTGNIEKYDQKNLPLASRQIQEEKPLNGHLVELEIYDYFFSSRTNPLLIDMPPPDMTA